MRQIEQDIINAIITRQDLCKSNSQVRCDGDLVEVYLHGHKILLLDFKRKKIMASSCGWHTNVTKSRLNAVLFYFCNVKIGQKNFEWFWARMKPKTREWSKDLEFKDGLEFTMKKL